MEHKDRVDHYDLIIVGGGIGGPALAATMAATGRSVLLLERSEVYQDQVRGEWLAPWGVAEAGRLDLYDVLIAAGAHHIRRHVTYDETLTLEEAREGAVALEAFVPGMSGPLALGHPRHCQALFDEAARRGATALRGVEVTAVFIGDNPRAVYEANGERREASARLIVGADGRNSIVRDACSILLSVDPIHHLFGGLLVDGVEGWDDAEQASGAFGDFAFLIFPQGDGKIRVFGSYGLADRARFEGKDGARRFLGQFRQKGSPAVALIADGRPAGPLRAFINSNASTETLSAEGAVLIGDAAGWNDPIVGLGLSITYRDARLVSDLLKTHDDWGDPDLFASYAEERRERMRRLRFVARLTARLDAEFGPVARARRRDYFHRAAADPSLKAHVVAVMAGPDAAPAETFTQAYRNRVLGMREED